MTANRQELLLANGRIHSFAGDDAPAGAILLRDGEVAWMGDAAAAPPAARTIDLGGRTVLPGLTDAHVHVFMLALGTLQMSQTQSGAASFADLARELERHYADAPEGTWLQGCDVIEDRLAEKRLPTRRDLDAWFPDRPVLLRRYCGHVAMLNTAALRALDLERAMPTACMQNLHRFEDGTPSGIAEEQAAEWIFARAPLPPTERMTQAIHDVLQECAALGINRADGGGGGFFQRS